MGNAASSFTRSAEKDELFSDFQLLDIVKVEDSRRYFSTKFDYHQHLLSFFQFDDVFLSWFGVKSHRQFKCFGAEVVSSMELFVIGYLLCSGKVLSYSDRLDCAMAFFQFPHTSESDEGLIHPDKIVTREEVTLFLETAACGLSRLASIDLVEQQYTVSIVDHIFGSDTFRAWEDVKVLLIMNQNITLFLQQFTEIVNWSVITRETEECIDLIEKKFSSYAQAMKICMEQANTEEMSMKIHPPTQLKSSKNLNSKLKLRKQKEKTKEKTSASSLNANENNSISLKVSVCVEFIENLVLQSPTLKPLNSSELEVLRFILDVVGRRGMVEREVFINICRSVMAFSFIDQFQRNQIYTQNIIELRDLTTGDYTSIIINESDMSDDDLDADNIKPPPEVIIKIPSKVIEIDGSIVPKDTASVLVAKLELQLSSTAECQRKGMALHGKQNVFYVTRMGWVEFHCNIFGKVGVDTLLLKAFQLLDTDNRGGLTPPQCASLVSERFRKSYPDAKAAILSSASDSLIEGNLVYIISEFVESTGNAHGLSRWESVLKESTVLDKQLGALRDYVKILEKHDRNCPEVFS